MAGTSGIVFDVKEFALYDGPGLRCTVFLKGCPLRCSWCHNPEGLRPEPEVMRTAAGSRQVGTRYSVAELAERLLRYAPLFKGTEGGITFSGGEPLLQAEFVLGVMAALGGKMHLLLQTSGLAPAETFLRAAERADLVFFDMKIMDPEQHRRYTGVDNGTILANAEALDRSGRRYRLRLPLIPGVTDTPENYTALREFIGSRLRRGSGLEGLDLLPYNIAAGGKYEAVGRKFAPGYDDKAGVRIQPDFFTDVVREVKVL